VGRTPIRDFPASNGHGRSAAAQPAEPHIGNLFVKVSDGVSFDALKQKLIAMCKDQGRDYGYLVATLGPELTPRLLYRVYAKDGRQELVRGAEFRQLDVRALRSDLIAAGDDYYINNRNDQIPASIVAPSILLDELVISRADNAQQKLPSYPPPDAPAVSASSSKK
jgi:hypothetical protein